jgi:hypothetical protein
MRKPKPSTSKPSSEELILPVVPVEDIPSQEATADVPSEPSVEKAPDMEASLAAIYQDQTGTVPDLSRLDRKRSKRWFWMITGGVILLACLALAAWTGFFLFQPYREFTGEGLRVKIDGPANMVLGKEETYTVTWSNQSVDPLSHAEIRVALPPDFVVTALSPEPSDRHLSLWKLGSLPPGGHGSISIQGVFVGALGTTSAIQVIGVYRPSGFGRDLEVLMNEPLVSTESVLEGVLQAPQKVLSGDTLSLVYTAGRGP